MSNPTSVVVLTDTLAQFLARTNQFGEANSTLVQQKFNKKQADGSSNPVFAALESRSRALAQWANLVDDFMLTAMADGSPLKGGGTFYNRIPTDSDTVENWDFDQTSPGVTNLTGTVAAKVLVPDGSLLSAVSVANGLTGLTLFNTGGFPGTQALRLADQDFNILGDITIDMLITWNGSGSAGAQIVGFFGSGETEPTNNIWQVVNHSGDGGGVGMAWERGAGINENHDVRVEPNDAGMYLLTARRDTTLETVDFAVNGVIAGSTSYGTGNEPTGGTSAELVVGRDDLEQLAFFGLQISNAARSDANILARAQAVGVAPL